MSVCHLVQSRQCAVSGFLDLCCCKQLSSGVKKDIMRAERLNQNSNIEAEQLNELKLAMKFHKAEVHHDKS